MINISELIHEDRIVPGFEAANREEAIRKLIEVLYASRSEGFFPMGQARCFDCIWSREKTQPTGIGEGLAFPHARIEGWPEVSVVLAISHQGVDFLAPDKKPAQFICLIISPDDRPYIILQAMSSIIRFIRENGNVQTLLQEGLTAHEIARRFHVSHLGASPQILAGNIMRGVTGKARLDMTIEEATRIMHLKHFDALPVVDEENKFCGEITCQEIFQLGVPAFFQQLKTVSFVRHIDPFEKYFRIRRTLKVKELMIRQVSPIREDATLMEIIFELTVKNKSTLYVVNEKGILLGIIDRFTVIDKVLFF